MEVADGTKEVFHAAGNVSVVRMDTSVGIIGNGYGGNAEFDGERINPMVESRRVWLRTLVGQLDMGREQALFR